MMNINKDEYILIDNLQKMYNESDIEYELYLIDIE